ncbi:MAG: hypothetical protein JWO08_2994 [Verrucomicrobiaceae bacterium]|nr:hypothetical protein [Verrucomicrobiaceae bacterium]
MIEPEDTDVQRLIRLKRYEQPPEGFVDDFLVQFQHRQRAEILRGSSIGLFWERVTAFMFGRVTPSMAVAGAAAAIVLVGGVATYLPHGGTVTSTAVAQAAPAPREQASNYREPFSASPLLVLDTDQVLPPMTTPQFAELLSQHFRGGFADEHAYKFNVNGWLDEADTGNRVQAAPLLDTPQNGSAANIQRQ